MGALPAREGAFTRLHVGRLGSRLAILALGALAEAQTVPPGACAQLDTLIGGRAETRTALGTQSGPSRSGWSIGAGIRLKS